MDTELEKLEVEALRFAPGERAALAQRLFVSLGEVTEIEEAWTQEVERRIAEVESGAVQRTGRVQFVGRRIVSSMQTTVESKGSE